MTLRLFLFLELLLTQQSVFLLDIVCGCHVKHGLFCIFEMMFFSLRIQLDIMHIQCMYCLFCGCGLTISPDDTFIGRNCSQEIECHNSCAMWMC